MKYTLAALAAMAVAAEAAITVVSQGDPNSGAHTNHAGPITGQGITSTADAQQVTNVTFQLRDGSGGEPGTNVQAYLHAYVGTTFNTATGAVTNYGTFLGVSDNSHEIGTAGVDLSAISFDFTNVAVTGNTEIFFMLNTGTTAGEGVVGTGLELVTGNPYGGGTALVTNGFHNTGLTWDINFEASFDNVAAVPEPSSTALLGLGGLALILRRRK